MSKKNIVKTKKCPTCNGTGSITNGGIFIKEGEAPREEITCKKCKGEGKIPVK